MDCLLEGFDFGFDPVLNFVFFEERLYLFLRDDDGGAHVVVVFLHADVGAACALTPDAALGGTETVDALAVLTFVHFYY